MTEKPRRANFCAARRAPPPVIVFAWRGGSLVLGLGAVVGGGTLLCRGPSRVCLLAPVVPPPGGRGFSFFFCDHPPPGSGPPLVPPLFPASVITAALCSSTNC